MPKKRVHIEFSEDAYAVLKRMAERRGTTVSEFVRDAVAFESWYDELKREGGQLLVQRKGEQAKELVRP